MVNLKSFEVPDKHGFLTGTLLEWTQALALVDRSPSRVTGGVAMHKALEGMNGYIFPPPAIFTNSDHGLHLLATWIILAPRWNGEISIGQNPLTCESAPKADTWRIGLRDFTGIFFPGALSHQGESSGQQSLAHLT
jgi:hypothetical protein